MESYPRQCSANGFTFTEIIEAQCGEDMIWCTSLEKCILEEDVCEEENPPLYGEISIDEVFEIAENCEGELIEDFTFNEETETVWIESELEKEGCDPACVVDVVDKTAVINLRCTGLIEE